MKVAIQDLIIKNEIQSEVITMLINHKDTSKKEKEKYEACVRFIHGFSQDLKNLLKQPE